MGTTLGCSHLDDCRGSTIVDSVRCLGILALRNMKMRQKSANAGDTYYKVTNKEHRRTCELSKLVECVMARVQRLHLDRSKLLIVYMEMMKQKERVVESTFAKYSSL